MITISVYSEESSKSDMAHTLIDIANQIRAGNTSGVNPSWTMSGEEEANPEDW